MSYLVIDLENNIKNKIGSHKGSAHCDDNKVVYAGWKRKDSGIEILHYNKGCPTLRESGPVICIYNDIELLVGHNIKHDLLYLLRDVAFKEEVFPNILIWDTALAEYLITGQDHKFPSLDDCSYKYGGTVKDSRIKDLWDSGVDTDDIDPDLMKDYLKADVENTEIVFLKQFQHCQEQGLLPLIWSQMLALKATTMMEHNGMYVDMSALETIEYTKRIEKADLEIKLYKLLWQLHSQLAPLPTDITGQFINLDSNQFISKVLFGGRVTFTEKELIGRYKTGAKAGQDKYKNVEKEIFLSALTVPKLEWETKVRGIYKVGEEELKEVLNTTLTIQLTDFIEVLLKYREVSKELSTYIEGLREVIYPSSYIHGNIHHTSTHTGRTSSSGPNLQNFTGED